MNRADKRTHRAQEKFNEVFEGYTQMSIEDYCKYNSEIECARQNKCDKCGWNPENKGKRMEEVKSNFANYKTKDRGLAYYLYCREFHPLYEGETGVFCFTYSAKLCEAIKNYERVKERYEG